MLPAHTLLVAAIFSLFMLGMGALIAYIAWTGRPREREDEDAGECPLPGMLA